MPGLAIPEAVPQGAVREDGEDLQLIDGPGRRGGGGSERAPERLRRIPGFATECTMEKGPGRIDPKEVDPVGAPGDSRRCLVHVHLPRRGGYRGWEATARRVRATVGGRRQRSRRAGE